MLAVYGAPVVITVGGLIVVRARKRRMQRALEEALGRDFDVVPSGGAVMAFRTRRAGHLFEARVLHDRQQQPWFITATRKLALGARSHRGPARRRHHPHHLVRSKSGPQVARARRGHRRPAALSLARRRAARRGGARRRRDDARAQPRPRGGAHPRRARGDERPARPRRRARGLLAGVALTIEGGESTRTVDEAVGASSGTPFGISTSDRK